MQLMIKESKDKNLPFKRETFRNYGKNIELYKGVEDWFKRINEFRIIVLWSAYSFCF